MGRHSNWTTEKLFCSHHQDRMVPTRRRIFTTPMLNVIKSQAGQKYQCTIFHQVLNKRCKSYSTISHNPSVASEEIRRSIFPFTVDQYILKDVKRASEYMVFSIQFVLGGFYLFFLVGGGGACKGTSVSILENHFYIPRRPSQHNQYLQPAIPTN